MDASSFSNPDAARVIHSDFEIDINFHTHVMEWWCNHTVNIEKMGASELILDTRDLDINAVSVSGADSKFTTGKSTKALGTAVHIPLPANLPVGSTVNVEINWTTSPNAVAAQWLANEQTAGGNHPFLFTQCQAIHARTLVPCQDTPGAKFTYTSAVRVPAHLRALMSALSADDLADEKVDFALFNISLFRPPQQNQMLIHKYIVSNNLFPSLPTYSLLLLAISSAKTFPQFPEFGVNQPQLTLPLTNLLKLLDI